MADRRGSTRREGARARGGFTLVEMLAALLILAFGVTTVFGVLSSGLATEETAALVRDASRLVTALRDKLQHEDTVGEIGTTAPADVQGARLPEFPDLTYDLHFEVDPERPYEVIVRVTVRWLRRGADVAETYRFPLPRGKPLHVRLRQTLSQQEKRQ